MSVKKKDPTITHHLEGFGIWFRHRGPVHFWKKDSWKSLCGHNTLNEISERWKMRFYPKRDNHFAKSKICKSCLIISKRIKLIIE